MSNTTEELNAVMVELFSRVGASYTPSAVKNNGWWAAHTWTTEEEEAFSKWLFNRLMKRKSARLALMAYPFKDEQFVNKFVSEFVNNYGWVIDNENQQP